MAPVSPKAATGASPFFGLVPRQPDLHPPGMTEHIEGFRGPVLGPTDEGYEEARRVWNGSIDRRPRLVARGTGAADVVAAVRHAREHDLLTAVRGGGHGVAGSAVCDDGIVIDLSLMKGILVDPAAQTARA